jgi:hypothetical protein
MPRSLRRLVLLLLGLLAVPGLSAAVTDNYGTPPQAQGRKIPLFYFQGSKSNDTGTSPIVFDVVVPIDLPAILTIRAAGLFQASGGGAANGFNVLIDGNTVSSCCTSATVGNTVYGFITVTIPGRVTATAQPLIYEGFSLDAATVAAITRTAITPSPTTKQSVHVQFKLVNSGFAGDISTITYVDVQLDQSRRQ